MAVTSTQLNKEIADRKAADTALGIRITNEINNRSTAANSLANRISILEAQIKLLVTPPVVPPVIPPIPTEIPLARAGELQTLIDLAPADSVVTIPLKQYVETIIISKPLTLRGNGSIISGKNVRTSWIDIMSDNVTIEEFTFKEAAPGAFQQGGITCLNHNNISLTRLHVTQGPNVGINFQNGSGHKFTDLEVDHCPMAGFGAGSLINFKMSSTGNAKWPARWHDNRTSVTENPLNEGGAFKISNSSGIEISGQEVDHNAGPGIWLDIDDVNVAVYNNNVHHNTHSGIFFEISRGKSLIYSNKVWENGYDITIDGKVYPYDSRGDEFGWPAAILCSSSKEIEIFGNVVAWNRVGVGFIYQGNRPNRQVPASQHYIHDNTIIGGIGRYLVTWNQDGTGGTLFSSNTNRGNSNDYFSENGDAINFHYQDGKTLAQYNLTNAEENGIYVSTPIKGALLITENIPIAPESGH